MEMDVPISGSFPDALLLPVLAFILQHAGKSTLHADPAMTEQAEQKLPNTVQLYSQFWEHLCLIQ